MSCVCGHDLGQHPPDPARPFAWPCRACDCREHRDWQTVVKAVGVRASGKVSPLAPLTRGGHMPTMGEAFAEAVDEMAVAWRVDRAELGERVAAQIEAQRAELEAELGWELNGETIGEAIDGILDLMNDLQTRCVMDTKVAEMLRTKPRTTAEPRAVRFGLQERAAAWFEQMRDTPQGSPAYANGEREYLHAGLYVLGGLPMAYQRDEHTVFVTADGGRWYVAAWADERAVANHPEYHPLGVWFLLKPESDQRKADGLTDGAPTFTFEVRA